MISVVIVCGTRFLFGIVCFSPSGILCVAEAWLYWNGRMTYPYSSVWQRYTKTKLSSVVHTIYATAITRQFNVAIYVPKYGEVAWWGVRGSKTVIHIHAAWMYVLTSTEDTLPFIHALTVPCNTECLHKRC